MLHYQIEVTTKKEFDRIFIKLAKLGFVYTLKRHKTIEEINNYWFHEYFPIIKFGSDDTCKMVLHGSVYLSNSYKTTTIDEFLTNIFPKYW